MSFSYLLMRFLNILSFGYGCCMPFLLLGWRILNNHRPVIIRFISIANRWFWVYALLFTLNFVYSLLYVVYMSRQLGVDFDRGPIYINANGYLIRLLIVPFIFLFFTKKRCRSILLSLFALAALFLSSFWFERLLVYLTNFYRDYLPSYWAVRSLNWWESDAFSLLLYLLLIGGTYWIQQKRIEQFQPKNS